LLRKRAFSLLSRGRYFRGGYFYVSEKYRREAEKGRERERKTYGTSDFITNAITSAGYSERNCRCKSNIAESFKTDLLRGQKGR
jgi:hypothetical protein